jgi:hypothetical protein
VSAGKVTLYGPTGFPRRVSPEAAKAAELLDAMPREDAERAVAMIRDTFGKSAAARTRDTLALMHKLMRAVNATHRKGGPK